LVKSNHTARFNAGKQNKTNPELFVSLEMSEHQQTRTDNGRRAIIGW